MSLSKTLQDMLNYIGEKFNTYGIKNPHVDLLLTSKGILDDLLLASPFVKMPKILKARPILSLEQEQVEKIYY